MKMRKKMVDLLILLLTALVLAIGGACDSGDDSSGSSTQVNGSGR